MILHLPKCFQPALNKLRAEVKSKEYESNKGVGLLGNLYHFYT